MHARFLTNDESNDVAVSLIKNRFFRDLWSQQFSIKSLIKITWASLKRERGAQIPGHDAKSVAGMLRRRMGDHS